eukprot:GHRQ01022526.1.p1 GENE.GHRQ01022526.1~~GHRQ01022526.1.p1  ORF type:complete len:378 (+),score=181.86 GHRQ01022526.1:160-1293(+)
MQKSAITRAQRRDTQDQQRAQKAVATMTLKAAELVLVRHGETDWNREHRLQGQQQPGPPLNQRGWQQCELLRGVLQQRFTHFDAVVSSDLLRTVQTAQVLAAAYSIQVQQHPGLRERNLGLLQGLTYAEGPVAQPAAWAALQRGSSSTRIPGGGESLNDLRQRMAATLLDIAGQYPGKRVLLVSHGGALHAAHRAARGYDARGKVVNCGISILMAEPSSSSCNGRRCSLPGQQQLASEQQHKQQPTCEQSQQRQQQDKLSQQQQHHKAHSRQTVAADEFSSKQHGRCIHLCSDSSAAGRHISTDGSRCGSKCNSGADGLGAEQQQAASSAHGGCLAADKQQAASSGRLALLVWNDGHELAERGMLDAAGFGGSANEA